MKLKQIYNTYDKARRLQTKYTHVRCAAVIVAAGSASRMQGQDKILADLCGAPVICRTMAAFQACQEVDEIILVTRPERMEELSLLAADYPKVRMIVPGGETRMDSVLNGVQVLDPKTKIVAVHDGARPLVTPEIIRAAVLKAAKFGAAAPAIPVKDTIKVAQEGSVRHTPERSSLYAVQTPQTFDCDLLKAALQNAKDKNLSVTDDCSAVEALGMRVMLTEGSEKNIKITTPLDLQLATVYWRGKA